MKSTDNRSKTKHTSAVRKHAAPIAVGLLTVGMVIALFNAQYLGGQIAYWLHTPAPVVVEEMEPQKEEIKKVAPEPKVIIPSLAIDAPVVYGMTSIAEPDIQRSLQDGVLHFADSPKPGQPGNGIYVGHSSNAPWAPGNYKFVFAPLERLELGDTFYLNYEEIQYTYKVVSKTVVLPNDVSVLNGTSTPSATLITCTPVGTNLKRLVIRGEQISPTPTVSDDETAATSIQALPGNN